VKVKPTIPGFFGIAALIVVMAAAVLTSIRTNDTIFLAAPAEAFDPHVAIAGHPRQPGRGALYITFVEEQPNASVLSRFYYQHFDPSVTIVPPDQQYGTSHPTQQQQQQQQQQSVVQMIDAKTAAEVAALNALGYPVPNEQVIVDYVEPGSKAVGKLRQNDVVLRFNGRQVHTLQQLSNAERGLKAGQRVTLAVRRTVFAGGSQTVNLTVPLVYSQQAKKAIVGFSPRTVLTGPIHLPYHIMIDTQDIQGPSAGLMMALTIINRLSPTDITHGHKIAGTGTIDVDGAVGAIGGVKQKIIGARKVGAEYFFVPGECDQQVCNYNEAKPYAQGIKLVPVYTLGEALAFLRTLH